MSVQKNNSDFKAMNVAERKKYLQDRSVLVSGYLKPSLVEIASAVERMGLPVDPNFEKDKTNDAVTLTIHDMVIPDPSYFCCRQQFVQFNSTCSFRQTIKCSVPQGSILGPLFFILYINDLPHASQLTQPLLFVDDTSIFYSHSDPKRLKCNKLSVNIKKTGYVIFKPRQRIANHDFNIFFGNQLLKQTNITIFLGVHLDEHLTWKHHISFLSKQIAKSIWYYI